MARSPLPLQAMTVHPATRLPALAAVLYVSCVVSVPLLAGGDTWIADRLYAWEGGTWALRDTWWLSTLVHARGRDASALLWCAVAVAWASTWLGGLAPTWRRPLAYLLGASLLSAVLVSLLKQRTGVDCPWDLARYGGTRPLLGLFDTRPDWMGRAACFPAGHASAGYGWFAAYFALAAVRPRWRWWGFGAAMSLGLVFGIGQQLRGAHFFSHDLWSATLAWLCAAVCARLWLPGVSAAPAKARTSAVPVTLPEAAR